MTQSNIAASLVLGFRVSGFRFRNRLKDYGAAFMAWGLISGLRGITLVSLI